MPGFQNFYTFEQHSQRIWRKHPHPKSQIWEEFWGTERELLAHYKSLKDYKSDIRPKLQEVPYQEHI